MTLREALTSATQRLSANPHLRATAARDAELLLLHATRLSRAALLAHPASELSADQQASYDGLVARRLGNEPIQYITGEQEFYGLLLRVTPAVLIPRPETEHLVEAVLQRLPQDHPVEIVDIGTGSGAIAIALARHLPHAHVTAIDLSIAALEVARANAEEHHVSSRVRFLHSDLLSGLEQTGEARLFDAIVSNPPYIPESDRLTLHPEVRDHEPSAALFSGSAGLDIYRRLIPQAHAALKPGGLLALEIGHGQRDALVTLLSSWQNITFIDDLQQIPRVALANR